MDAVLWTLLVAISYCVTADATRLGEYVRAGLGITTTLPPTTTSTPPYSTTYANTTSELTANLQNDTKSAEQQCYESWANYSSTSSEWGYYYESSLVTVVYTNVAANFTYGTGSVYTTSAGIPVASGTFTPTKVVATIVDETVAYMSLVQYTIASPATTAAIPTCSTDSPSKCSRLYVSYMQSLGLGQNATVPTITPVPTNSPLCPKSNYEYVGGCGSYQTYDEATLICTLFGNNVQVFYFPPERTNTTANTTATHGNVTTAPIFVQSYAPGVTFTSPSIYLSFDSLSARSYESYFRTCSSCGPDGCQYTIESSVVSHPHGTDITDGTLISMDLKDVSTLQFSTNPPSVASSIANVLAHGLPGWGLYYYEVEALDQYVEVPLDLEAIEHPSPIDYYLKPEVGEGCGDDGQWGTPECATIWEGEYRPFLALPYAQIELLQQAWNTCQNALYGVYDPPSALTQVSIENGVSQYPQSTTAAVQPSSTNTPPPASPEPTATPNLPGPTTPLQQTSATSTEIADPIVQGSSSSADPASQAPSSSTDPAIQAPSSSADPVVSEPSSSAIPPSDTPERSTSIVQDPSTPSAQSDDPVGTTSQPMNEPTSRSSADVVVSPPIAASPATTTNALSILQSAKDDATLTATVPSQPLAGNPPPTASHQQLYTGDPPTETEPLSVAGSPTTAIVGSQAFTISQLVDDGGHGAIVVSNAGSAATITAGGTIVSLGGQVISVPSEGGVVIGTGSKAASFTLAPTSPERSDPLVTIGGTAFTVKSQPAATVLQNDATTITLKDGASSATINGQVVGAISSGGLVIGDGSSTTTVNVDSSPFASAISIGNQPWTAQRQPSGGGEVFVNAGSTFTLEPGEAPSTINGQLVSADSSGIIVVGTSTLYLDDPSGVLSTTPAVFSEVSIPSSGARLVSIGSEVYTASAGSSSAVILGGITILPGTATVLDGEVVSLSGSDLLLAPDRSPTSTSPGESTTSGSSNSRTTAAPSALSSGPGSFGAVTGGSLATSSKATTSAGSSIRCQTLLAMLPWSVFVVLAVEICT